MTPAQGAHPAATVLPALGLPAARRRTSAGPSSTIHTRFTAGTMPPWRAGSSLLLSITLSALFAPIAYAHSLAEPKPTQWHTDCSAERLKLLAAISRHHAVKYTTARGLAEAVERVDSSAPPTGTRDRTVRPEPELQPQRTSQLHSNVAPAEHADLQPRRYQRRHSVLVNLQNSRNANHHHEPPVDEELSQHEDRCPRNDHRQGPVDSAAPQGGCNTHHTGQTVSHTHSALRKLQQLLLAAGGLSAQVPSEQPAAGSAVPNMYDKQQMTGGAAGQGSLLLGAGGAPGMAASLSQRHPEYNNLLASDGSPLIQGYPQGDGTAGAQGGPSTASTGQGGAGRQAAGAGGAGRPGQAPGTAGATQAGGQQQQQQQQVASFSNQLYSLIMSNPLTASLLDPATAAYMGTAPPAAVAATNIAPAPIGGTTSGAAGGVRAQQGAAGGGSSGGIGLGQLEGSWLQAWDQAWQGAAPPAGSGAAVAGAAGGAPQPAGAGGAVGGLGAAAGQSFQLGSSSTSTPTTDSSAPLNVGGEGGGEGSGAVQGDGIAGSDTLLPTAAKPPGVGLLVEPKEDKKVSSGDVLLALGALYSNAQQQLQQGSEVSTDGGEASDATADGTEGRGDAAQAQEGADYEEEYDSDMYGSTEVGGTGAAGSEAQPAVWRQAVQQLGQAGGGLAGGASSSGQGSGDEGDSGSVRPTFRAAGGVASGLRQRLGSVLASALSSGGGGGGKAGPAGTAPGRQGSAATGSPAGSGAGASGAVRSGVGGSSAGRGGLGGVGGGGTNGGNGTGPGLFPSCLPPLLLCADRDLVTLLGVTTDQVRMGGGQERPKAGLDSGPRVRYGVAGCTRPFDNQRSLCLVSFDGGGSG